ncbi:LDH2 family malate/lactate/ureidoglycolate dehydrogenase [Neobacillus niacini]|uniref:Ldh family oxidoreductase n=1 Tax=Neobacillus niacini TaxID=86668 RepID=UPI00277FC0A1|nr:Ldh family oxidoreductase [Neobacillus niacini]MDQ1002199.1 LDH2 family malate/lactate/ureidoglycolate dehydrogenase [Neobacillus niacini]
MINIQAVELENYVREIFLAVGLNQEEAIETAKHLVTADLKGVSSHGVHRVPIYVKRLRLNVISNNSSILVERETPVSLKVNGGNGIGPYVVRQAIELGIQKAKDIGMCAVAIHHSNHAGILSYYTELAVKNDLIAFATTNAPANMAPFGGKERYFGTNPFSIGVPAGNELPYILDMATSVVAKGKIIKAMNDNKSIPLGWAIDKDGNDTTDSKAAFDGLVLPLGGAKGYGLAFMVDIFSGILSGANWGPHINDLYSNFETPQNLGQFIWLMRPDLFMEMEDFKARMDQAIREIRSVEKTPSISRIYIPGELEHDLYVNRMEEGIPLEDTIWTELKLLGDELGLNKSYVI